MKNSPLTSQAALIPHDTLLVEPGSATTAKARQPLTARAAEVIKQRIKCGAYNPGEQLPSIRSLSSELGLSHRVVQRAIEQLEGEGILETRHGIGATILASADCSSTALWFGFVQPYFSRFAQTLQAYLEDALDEQSNLCVIKSSRNDATRERREVERLIAGGINGLLIWPVEGDTNNDYLREVARRMPVVFVDRTLPDVTAPSVVLDVGEAGRQIVRTLFRSNDRRILVICDPADISTFNQLKSGLREEARTLKIEDTFTLLDYPVIQIIEASYTGNYAQADAAYEELAPLLLSGQYDAIFCPQSEFFDLVFSDKQRAAALANVHCVTMRILDGTVHSRHYQELEIDEWILDTAQMIVVALDLLQNMTLKRRSWQRTIRLPVTLRQQDAAANSAMAALTAP